MLDECCESVLKAAEMPLEKTVLIAAVFSAFSTSISVLKSTLIGLMDAEDANQVTLNYRGGQFIIPRDSALIN